MKVKVTIKDGAFDWMTETRAAQEYGTRAAKAFAKVMRTEMRSFWLCCDHVLDGSDNPHIAAHDSQGTDWIVYVPLEPLLNKCARFSFDCDQPEALDNMIGVLERSLKKARRLRAKLGA